VSKLIVRLSDFDAKFILSFSMRVVGSNLRSPRPYSSRVPLYWPVRVQGLWRSSHHLGTCIEEHRSTDVACEHAERIIHAEALCSEAGRLATPILVDNVCRDISTHQPH